ncbi:hypothetical protein ACQ4M3_13335 [Leptolyngbya sp. AN03gr2]|uniref:hypothetical protein n=1 Tax=unclassified Leptolyngbya TaxID=2650499 RepID=UPI003D31935F
MGQIWGVQGSTVFRQLTFYLPDRLPIPRFTLGSRVICCDLNSDDESTPMLGMVVGMGYYTQKTVRLYGGKESFWEYVVELDQPLGEVHGQLCYEHIAREETLRPDASASIPSVSKRFLGFTTRIAVLLHRFRSFFAIANASIRS